MRNGQQSSGSEIISALYESALRPELYLEFAKAWERGIIAPLIDGSPVKATEIEEMERHFRLALRIFEATSLTKQQSVQDFLDKQNFAAAIIRADGRQIACNAPFSARFSLDGTALLHDRLERLTYAGTNGRKQQQQTIWPTAENTPVAARYYYPDGGQEIVILECLDGDQIGLLDESPVYLVKSCQAEWTSAGANILRDSFGLTSAELEIGKSLYEGRHTADIAQTRHTAVNTVRKQIKSLLAKTMVGHQSELIGLITGLMHVVASRPGQSDQFKAIFTAGDSFHASTLHQLPKKRILQLEKYGAVDGKPILFIHGHTSSAVPTRSLMEYAARENLQILAPCKPGVGGSSPDNGRFDPMAFIEDCLTVLDGMGIKQVPIAGHAMSGVYAINAAAKFPHRFSSVALLDTGVPFKQEDQLLKMPEGSRRIFHTAWKTPELLYAPLAFASRTFGQSEEHQLTVMKSQFAESKHDSELLVSPDYYALARNAMADFFSTPRRSVDELVYWVSDWTPTLEKVSENAPVLFIHSKKHDWLPYQDVISFCAERTNVDAIILEDTAQLFVYEKSQSFCIALSKMIE